MTFRFGFGEATIVLIVALLALAMLVLPEYDRPPLASVQNGFRGTSMLQVYNPREVTDSLPANQVAEIEGLPPLVEAGPRAADSYQNVQVLGDLSTAQFLRLMTAITAWVSPEQGCAYCHEGGNFANDDLYTKRVSRWMIHMTRTINNEWANHVQNAWDGSSDGAGVNCYTCHRGNNVPEYVWFQDPDVALPQGGLLGWRAGQNKPAPQAELASLPPAFSAYLMNYDETVSDAIRVQGANALPAGNRNSTKQTELTYSLMMHMAGALGVNCTYCHNSRAWSSWEQSTPQRTTAWYGIRMNQAVNDNYILPSVVALPDHRKGPLGNPAMVNCATCHQNVYKPLYGANMIEDWPSLTAANYVERERLEPGLGDAAASMEIGAAINAEGLATGGNDEAADASGAEDKAASDVAAASPEASGTDGASAPDGTDGTADVNANDAAKATDAQSGDAASTETVEVETQ